MIKWTNPQDCFIEGTKGNVKYFINIKKVNNVHEVQSLYILKKIDEQTTSKVKILPKDDKKKSIVIMKQIAENYDTSK